MSAHVHEVAPAELPVPLGQAWQRGLGLVGVPPGLKVLLRHVKHPEPRGPVNRPCPGGQMYTVQLRVVVPAPGVVVPEGHAVQLAPTPPVL